MSQIHSGCAHLLFSDAFVLIINFQFCISFGYCCNCIFCIYFESDFLTINFESGRPLRDLRFNGVNIQSYRILTLIKPISANCNIYSVEFVVPTGTSSDLSKHTSFLCRPFAMFQRFQNDQSRYRCNIHHLLPQIHLCGGPLLYRTGIERPFSCLCQTSWVGFQIFGSYLIHFLP